MSSSRGRLSIGFPPHGPGNTQDCCTSPPASKHQSPIRTPQQGSVDLMPICRRSRRLKVKVHSNYWTNRCLNSIRRVCSTSSVFAFYQFPRIQSPHSPLVSSPVFFPCFLPLCFPCRQGFPLHVAVLTVPFVCAFLLLECVSFGAPVRHLRQNRASGRRRTLPETPIRS